MVQTAYPQHEWNVDLLHKIGTWTKASQRQLMLAVQHLFPTHGIYFYKSNVNNIGSGRGKLQ